MYSRALFDIIHASGDAVLQRLVALEGGADELFASRLTLAEVESGLRTVATTLAHLPPVVMLRLPQVDWAGWDALLRALAPGQTAPRREVIWYGACALLPATLALLDELRRREPDWFEIQY
ncbi:MAG: hypothetical protein L6Q74_08425 [Sphaerotilus natans subsp. sulfidivorans]|uniref:hypothetical protein n=1 Tax=Sphaerotilus sulfidivorans TaxID=639200 RepID=UPI0023566591|nr:hypothetical protein [Sphaerotilus sulfidivorans]MCK6401916.1 hypothetical protein [Sphaerotilus sulfidivorans]